jgi:hypothetical protein
MENKMDGSLPTDDPFARFKNERDFQAQSPRQNAVAAMDWAIAEIIQARDDIITLRAALQNIADDFHPSTETAVYANRVLKVVRARARLS